MKLDIDLTEEQIERIKKMLAEEEVSTEIEFVDIPNRSYKMGKYAVTQAQWEAVMGTNPSTKKGPNLPVTNVSYYDVKEFINKLNESADYVVYALPTEDQWEYCCRAGEENPEERLDERAWYCNNSSGTLQEVGKKKPNAWGLYDMLGNVWEWTDSEY